jgi:Ca2+/Na+ antiporter|tara:strand:- start:465 stop:695 length:231 start_codon:yes stop_codon:yes gene_type:complete
MKKPILFVLFLMLLFSYSAEAQCAMCRAVIESEENGEMAKGINNGIIYLMVFPYLLVGGIGYIIYRSRRKKRAELP